MSAERRVPDALCCDRFGPGSCCDGSDAVGHGHEGVPSGAARLDDDAVVGKYAVRKLVLPQVLPDVFDRFSMMPLYAGFLQRSGEECDPAFPCLTWSSSASVICTIQIC